VTLSARRQLELWVEAVHDDGGLTAVVRAPANQVEGNWPKAFAATTADIVNLAWRFENENQWNVYIAPAAFSQTKREGSSFHSSRALYIDVDVRNDDKHFHSEQEALGALVKILQPAGYPPPNLIVWTGHGLQCLWTMTRTNNTTDWNARASFLKTLLVSNGYKFDAPLTTDTVRLLRPSGLTNRKHLPWVPTILRHGPKPAYQPEQLPMLQEVAKVFRPSVATIAGMPASPLSPALLQAHGQLANNLSGGVTQRPFEPHDMAAACRNCQILRGVKADNGRSCSEPQWFNALQLAAHCKDGEQWAHDLSKGHADYDPDQTQRKYEKQLEKATEVPPISCETMRGAFATNGHSHDPPWDQLPGLSRTDPCAECPYEGHIKNPLLTENARISITEDSYSILHGDGLGVY
jgi:hypothetical protein